MKRSALLDSLSIAAPCDVPWSSMRGNDWVRSCGQCRKNVYNVSHMTRAEALDVIGRSEGRICLQLSRRLDGTIATADCWTRLRRARRRGLLTFLVALPVALAVQLGAMVVGIVTLRAFLRRPPPPAAAAPNPNAELETKLLGAKLTAIRAPHSWGGLPPRHTVDEIRKDYRRRHELKKSR